MAELDEPSPVVGAALLPLELVPDGWSLALGVLEELAPPLAGLDELLDGVDGVALEDELAPLLGVEEVSLELEEPEESFLFTSAEPDIEPEDAGGVLVPEEDDADPEDGFEGAGVALEDDDPDGEDGTTVVLEDEPDDGRSARAPGRSPGPRSQP